VNKMKPWGMKRNTYRIYPEGSRAQGLFICLGIRKAKKFDHGVGGYRQSNSTIKWKGTYSDTPFGWEGLVKRCQELHDLGIFRDMEGENNGPV